MIFGFSGLRESFSARHGYTKMSRATHFVGTADLPQSKRTRRAGGRRFRVGPEAAALKSPQC